jgi:hypothetical protein
MSESRYVATKLALAGRCGVSYPTLLKYFSKPGRPRNHSPGGARYDVEAWRQWIAEHRSAHNFGKNGADRLEYEPNERERALIEKNKVEAERARFKLKVEVGEFLPRYDVCRDVEAAHSAVRRELTKALIHELPPRLEGLCAIEMRRPMRRVCEELADQLFSRLNGYGNDEFATVTVNGSG